MKGGGHRRRHPSGWAVLLVLVLFMGLMLSPFLVVAMNALKSPPEYSSRGRSPGRATSPWR